MPNVVTTKKRVYLEPVLEAKVGSMRPRARRLLAKKFYRWSIQLFVSARIMEMDEEPKPKPKLFIHPSKAKQN